MLHLGQDALALGPQFGAVGLLLGAGGMGRLPQFQLGQAQHLVQAVHQGIQMFQRDEGRIQMGAQLPHLVGVQADDLGIAGDHGTVVAPHRGILPFTRQAGEEDLPHALAQQGRHMAVSQLGGIADRLGRHGRKAQVVQFLARCRRKLHPVAQPGEKGEPEGIVLIDVEHTGDAHAAARGLLRLQRPVAEQAPGLPGVDIGHDRDIVLRMPHAAAFAAVAGHEAVPVGEAVHLEQAMVAAAAAAHGPGRDLQRAQPGGTQGRALLLPGAAAQGQQGRAVRAHEPGDVGAADLALQQVFHDAQQGIVHEGAALHQHAFAQLVGRAQAQHLVQGIADDGIAEPGRDVADGGAFLLGLLDLGIHEHRAARAQIHGMAGKERGLHEVFHAQVQALGKGLQKGPAAGGTGFVEGHARDAALPDLEAFHVLAADVDDIGGVRHQA